MPEKYPNNSWEEYYERTKEMPPRELLVKALPYVNNRNEALDLGASALNDTRYLLKEGFLHVTAVDKKSVAIEIAEKLPVDRFTYAISSFEDFEFLEGKYDIVDAQYSLPFTSKENFEDVFTKMKHSLVKDGIFTGQLFGERDERNTPSNTMIFHEKSDVERLLSDMEIIEFQEEEKDDNTILSSAPQHLHIFHIIAKRK